MSAVNWKRFWLALLVQWAIMAVLSAGVVFLPLLFSSIVILRIYSWGVLQALGALSAYWVTRRGVSNYISWLAPPILYSAVPWLILQFPPEAGVMLLMAFVSIVGAAAGDVVNKRRGAK